MPLTIGQIEACLAAMKSRYNQAAGQLALLEEQRVEKQKALEQLQENIRTWEMVQVLLARTSEFAREQLKRRIEEIVTAALQAVWEDDRQFIINLFSYNNQPAADFAVLKRGPNGEFIEVHPYDGSGGGLADVVSMALRLSLMELTRPKPGGPAILDEPAKHVDNENAGVKISNIARFLGKYTENTNRQFIFISHNQVLEQVAHKVYKTRAIDQITCEVKEIA
ncbi:MAG: hypothetical protein GX425_07705 [Peptococcaceae bacterium]|nr:hypothetical protein [Peptococcaceae bacterium]